MVDWLCYLLVCFRHSCYIFYRPCEVDTHVSEELPEDEPEDGSVLDEDVEDHVHTDEEDQDV